MMQTKKYLSYNFLKNGIKKKINKARNQLGNSIGYRLVKIEKYPAKYWNRYKLKNNQDLKIDYRNYSNLKLHFGCGPRVLKNWINIDLVFEPYEDYLRYYKEHYTEEIRGSIADFYAIDIITQGLALPDNSVNCIFHEDFFEHLNQRDQIVFLAETLRVMKKGTVHRINTPNILASMRENSFFKKGKDGVFVNEWNVWHHHNIISPTILKEMALMVGYSSVEFNGKNASAIKDQLPIEYRPDELDRSSLDGNIFADLIK